MRVRSLLSVLVLVTLLPNLTSAPAVADAPVPTGLDADHATFWFHTTKDLTCSQAAAALAGTPWKHPFLYATGASSDPCAAADEPTNAGVSSIQGGGVLKVHFLPLPDRTLDLTAGAPITFDVWIWTVQAGATSPRLTLRAAGLERQSDPGAVIDPVDVQIAQGKVWQRFVGSFGTAPATLGAGPITLEVDLADDGDVRQLGAFQSGVGTTGAHRSSVTVPMVGLSGDPVPIETWPPPIATATVRPGVQASTSAGQCTTNFVYRARDAAHEGIYLGLAAHCVDGVPMGGPIAVRTTAGASAFTGTLGFDSWKAIGFVPQPSGVGDDIHPFDFALIKVPVGQESKVHPAVMDFGGPTGVQNTCTVGAGSRVFGFGNSGLRPGPAILDEHEGVTTGRLNSCFTVEVVTVTPGIPGDSGSGIMTKSGKAVGVASYLTLVPPGLNGFSSVSKALEYMNANGWDIEIVTWALIKPGLLPV